MYNSQCQGYDTDAHSYWPVPHYRRGRRKHLLARRTSTTAKTFANVTSNFVNHFSIIPSHLAKKMSAYYPGIKLVSAVRKFRRLTLCRLVLTLSTQLQNMSFPAVERTRTTVKYTKMKNVRAKRAKPLFFIVNHANVQCSCSRRHHGCDTRKHTTVRNP